MFYALPLIVIVIIALVVFYARNKAVYYKKLFSDEHYTEIGNWLASVLTLGMVDESQVEDATALRTFAECALSYTRTMDEADTVHIAFSQIGGVTTHAASNRIFFFILQMLKENKADARFFYTESGVHHAVLSKNTGAEWVTRPVADALADMAHYQPIPFQLETVKEEPATGGSLA